MATVEESLCTNCGLCCDGSLFAEVELSGSRESTAMEAMGLQVEDDDRPLLIQPCAALKNKRCSIYQFRPKCCRTFECRLLQRVKKGAIPIAAAQLQIAELRKRLAAEPSADSRRQLINQNFL